MAQAPDKEHTLVVDGKTLEVIFGEHGNDQLWPEFQEIAIEMVSVTCCRVSPDMKATVTRAVKEHHPARPVTLAIGDGANDVPMIQAAHVGIGISGVEGRQAVQASDYAVGQFRFLQPLLLVHGRWSYLRNTYVVCYSFYKNISFSPAQYWWAFASASSGQKFYIEAGYQLFNVSFAALPIIAYGIWEQDVSSDLSLKYPHLYKLGRENGLYTPRAFAVWFIQAIYHSLVLYIIIRFAIGDSVYSDGSPIGTTWVLGSTIFGADIVIVNLVIALHSRYWFWVPHLFIWGSILMWPTVLAVCSSAAKTYSADNVGDYKMMDVMYGSAAIWLASLLAVVTALVPTIAHAVLQNDEGGAFGPAYAVRVKHRHEVETGFFYCGLCGCPPGKSPACCGEGCVNRHKDDNFPQSISAAFSSHDKISAMPCEPPGGAKIDLDEIADPPRSTCADQMRHPGHLKQATSSTEFKVTDQGDGIALVTSSRKHRFV